MGAMNVGSLIITSNAVQFVAAVRGVHQNVVRAYPDEVAGVNVQAVKIIRVWPFICSLNVVTATVNYEPIGSCILIDFALAPRRNFPNARQ
jgi:hypothetical protein